MYRSCRLVAIIGLCCWSLALNNLADGQPNITQPENIQGPVYQPLGPIPIGGAPKITDAASVSNPAPGPTSPIAPVSVLSEEQRVFEQYRSSPLYVPPIEPQLISIPNEQLIFVREVCASDKQFFTEILDEAVSKRDRKAPSVRLIWTYGRKLISTLIKHRRDEMKIKPRYEPNPGFYSMIARLSKTSLDGSAQVKKDKGYTKKTVDAELFRSRVINLLAYIQRVVGISPVGVYIKWNEAKVYMDEPTHGSHGLYLVDEVTDLLAQFRAIGYDTTIGFGGKIVSLLNLFAGGKVPESESEIS